MCLKTCGGARLLGSPKKPVPNGDIYEGNISFDDKRFVNKMCDTLWQEIDDIKEGNIKASNIEICEKYEELIRIVEIERFAQGAKFMHELMEEIEVVK